MKSEARDPVGSVNSSPPRRAIAKGLLWTVPSAVVATTAPAFAASCPPQAYTAPFTTEYYRRESTTAATGQSSPVEGAQPVTYTVTSESIGGKNLQPSNLTVAGDINGGYNGLGDLRSDGLQLQQTGGTGGYPSRQVLTITFDRPVSDLRLTIADIDRRGSSDLTTSTSTYHDGIAVAPTVAVVNSGSVTGAANTGDPLRATRVGERNSDDMTTRSTVSVLEPTRSVSITYWSITGSYYQQVFLTGMSFTAEGC